MNRKVLFEVKLTSDLNPEKKNHGPLNRQNNFLRFKTLHTSTERKEIVLFFTIQLWKTIL